MKEAHSFEWASLVSMPPSGRHGGGTGDGGAWLGGIRSFDSIHQAVD